MGWFEAIFLGIVQGLTEFFPVSSSGHLAIFSNLLNVQNPEEGHLFFDVLLHLGTLVAVIIVYWKDIVEMVRAFIAIFTGSKGTEAHPIEASKGRLAIMIIIATLPLVVVIPIKDYIEQLGTKLWFVGIMLLITGAMLYFSDKLVVGKRGEKSMTATNALLVGLAQCLGTVPGISRSGITITAGLMSSFNREFAVRFSFLMSIPCILGANIISLFTSIGSLDVSLLPKYLLGVIAAGVVGYFSIRAVKHLVVTDKFGKVFSIWCWIAGGVAIIGNIVLSIIK